MDEETEPVRSYVEHLNVTNLLLTIIAICLVILVIEELGDDDKSVFVDGGRLNTIDHVLKLDLDSIEKPLSVEDARYDFGKLPNSFAGKTELEKMELAFIGNHSKEEIKGQLDKAMELHGIMETEENYSRCGSILIMLRKENAVSEMAIIDHMIRSHVPQMDGGHASFQTAAVISASHLALDLL